jgi:hypothetical protein
MRLLTSSAVAVTLFVGGPHAAQSAEFYMFGAATTHCSDFLQAMDVERKARVADPIPTEPGISITDTDEFRRFGNFADGFLSGVNYAYAYEYASEQGTTGHSTDQWGRALWLENYCRRRPLEEYINALIALRKHLATQQH